MCIQVICHYSTPTPPPPVHEKTKAQAVQNLYPADGYQPRPQGFSHFFKGKALGTRLDGYIARDL